ncbi:hypothetical protein E1267_04770 [Nonomuraea longispora]|uniref:Beta-lactamase class A catalytic domain-containing protein n=1 Tax=Nonomuraea longispora TaxID=1848320 RepID=A0A4R4NR01_9ACTN|nr:serine hydrolase [Nonomuraea longispora]TDC10340.1 hypothetical protein E1267_04770 [Nonomuraea longispora]
MTIATGALATIEQARETLAAAGTTGAFHARPVGGGAELALDADAEYAPHRLSTAYRDGPKIAGKTGTFYGGVRNEVGVVDFGGGEEYAVAIFLRQHDFDLRDARADAAIGAVARLLVDRLRSTR